MGVAVKRQQRNASCKIEAIGGCLTAVGAFVPLKLKTSAGMGWTVRQKDEPHREIEEQTGSGCSVLGGWRHTKDRRKGTQAMFAKESEAGGLQSCGGEFWQGKALGSRRSKHFQNEFPTCFSFSDLDYCENKLFAD